MATLHTARYGRRPDGSAEAQSAPVGTERLDPVRRRGHTRHHPGPGPALVEVRHPEGHPHPGHGPHPTAGGGRHRQRGGLHRDHAGTPSRPSLDVDQLLPDGCCRGVDLAGRPAHGHRSRAASASASRGPSRSIANHSGPRSPDGSVVARTSRSPRPLQPSTRAIEHVEHQGGMQGAVLVDGPPRAEHLDGLGGRRVRWWPGAHPHTAAPSTAPPGSTGCRGGRRTRTTPRPTTPDAWARSSARCPAGRAR